MRVILDTNILLSGLLSPSGIPARLVDAWLDRRFVLVSHSIQLDEFRAVSRRDKIRNLVRPPEAGRSVSQIAALAEMPLRLPQAQRSRDPCDDFLLAVCEAGSANRLVTGDKDDLLALRQHGATRILTAATFAMEIDL